MPLSLPAGLAAPILLASLPHDAAMLMRCSGPACPLVLAQATPDASGAGQAAPNDGSAPPAPQPSATPQAAAPAGTVPSSPPQPGSPPGSPAVSGNAGTAPPSPLGTVRNNPGTAIPNAGGVDPQYYGGTLSSPGRAQGSLTPAYGGTQRNTGLSDLDNAQPVMGASPYGGTQSTIGTPQFSTIYGRPTSTVANAPAQTRSLTGTTLPGNPGDDSRAPLGSVPLTRDQINSFGGTAGYTAQGVYTGTAGQSIGYGQPYPLGGRPVGGVASSTPDATTPLRPYVPSNTGRGTGPTNSGYGIPNGSRPTTMDARGVQRIN